MHVVLRQHWLLFVVAALLTGMPSTADDYDFDTDIIPVLTRFGCNSGRCHGAAAGRGGFHLSLFGSRPADDFQAITEELEGRRIHLLQPDQSLLLLKPTGQVDHGGDIRFGSGDEPAEVLADWIRQGARRNPAMIPPTVRIDVQPQVMTLTTGADGQQEALGRIRVLASSASKSSEQPEDVTRWAVLTANDPARVLVHPDGLVTVRHPGQHIVLARYLNQVTPVLLTVPRVPASTDAEFSDVAAPHSTNPIAQQQQDSADDPSVSAIDALIGRQLDVMNVECHGPVDDATFLRRVTLDVAGRLPTPAEQNEFADDDRDNKRLSKIDELLGSADFDAFWTFRLGQMLGLGRADTAESTATFHSWIARQVQRRTPMDVLVSELLLAEGNPIEHGPASFYLAANDARLQTEFVTEALLGIRLRCANCHDHPLDQWTQDDYHGLAAVFARIERGTEIRYVPHGTVIHPGTGQPAMPRIPGHRSLASDEDGRQALLAWMLDSKEPRFARALVNRVWQQLMGRGLVNPPDDLRQTNPASHPALWDDLSNQLIRKGYDLRWLVREICRSQAYARTTDVGDVLALDLYGSRQRRTLEPHVLLDAICDVTGVPETWNSDGLRLRAVHLVNPRRESSALDALGRCPNPAACNDLSDSNVAFDLPLALHLINGPLLNEKLQSTSGHLHHWLSSNLSDEEIILQAWKLSLCRPPTERERQFWSEELSRVATPTQRKAVAEDLLWSLLTCDEFLTVR